MLQEISVIRDFTYPGLQYPWKGVEIHGKSMEYHGLSWTNHGNPWKRNAFPLKASIPWTNVHGQNTKMTGKLWNLSMGLMEFVHGRTI